MLMVTNKEQRSTFGKMVKDEWKRRQWIMGTWVYAYISGERPIVVTTTIHAKDRMRFRISHPTYKAFVVYDVAR